MKLLLYLFISTAVVKSFSNPVPASEDFSKSVIELKAAPNSDAEVTRTKKSTTTFCVEIRPSSPSQPPYQVCEPYPKQPAYPSKEYTSAPATAATPAPAYIAPAAAAPVYASSAKPYSSPVHAASAYASKQEHSAPAYQHSPYTSVTSYREALEKIQSRMGIDDSEEEPTSRSVEDEDAHEHLAKSSYGNYGGVPSYEHHQPVAYISPLPKHKKKLLAKKLGKLGGHNGLVISCQPSLTGYASSIPTSGGYGGYGVSYRSAYGPAPYSPPKQYSYQPPAYKLPAYAPSYKPPAYRPSYQPSTYAPPHPQYKPYAPIHHPKPVQYGSSYAPYHAESTYAPQPPTYGTPEVASYSPPHVEHAYAEALHVPAYSAPHYSKPAMPHKSYGTPPPYSPPATYRSSLNNDNIDLVLKTDSTRQRSLETGSHSEHSESSHRISEEKPAGSSISNDHTNPQVGSALGGNWQTADMRQTAEAVDMTPQVGSTLAGGWRTSDVELHDPIQPHTPNLGGHWRSTSTDVMNQEMNHQGGSSLAESWRTSDMETQNQVKPHTPNLGGHWRTASTDLMNEPINHQDSSSLSGGWRTAGMDLEADMKSTDNLMLGDTQVVDNKISDID